MHNILLLSLTISFAAGVWAINCYTCESVYEPHCGEDFKKENYWKLDCSRVSAPRYLQQDDESSMNATGCMKRIYEVNGEQRVERNCFFGNTSFKEVGCKMDPSMMAVVEIDCLVCDDENYCNGAWSAEATALWTSITTAALFVLFTEMFN